jgi:nucleotide-binding universal stress UspA family protein
MRALRKILHPTDFSSGAEPATELAIEFAAKFAAELTLLHVYNFQLYVGPLGDAYPISPDALLRAEEEIQRALAQTAERARAAGVPVAVQRVDGIASDVILACAADMDLIVMGTHGRSGLKHFLLGSVAEQVMRAASCPVMTVRGGG